MILETILGGGITGLVGNIFTSIVSYKNSKLKYAHEIEKIKAESEAMKLEAEMNIAVAQAKVEGDIQLADAKAFDTSQGVGNQPMFSDKWIEKLFTVEGWVKYISIPLAVLIAFSFAFVDFLRGFMRPGLTMYMTFMSTVITMMAWNILQQQGITLTSTEALNIFNNVINVIVYLTVTCVCWWFGDRQMEKHIMKITSKNSK